MFFDAHRLIRTFQSGTLTAALTQSRAWLNWVSFLDQKLRTTGLPSGETVIHLLQEFLDAQEVSGTGLLKLVRQHFDIERLYRDGTYGFPMPGEGWIRVDRPFGELFRRDAQLAVGEATSSRQHSVEAHQIGHLFYATLAERTKPNRLDHRIRTCEAERFCWDFALGVFCPKHERQRWDAAYANSLLGPGEENLVSQLKLKEPRTLSFWHIRALAQRHRISMRMTVVALDRHSLLDELECGIAILRQMPNPATSDDVCLRVWQRARPSWGYLIRNQRATKQGFLSAETVFEWGENQKSVTVEERLRLKYFCPNEKVKWPVHTTATTCVYTREKCFAAGIDGYVAKPVRLAELSEAIARLLPVKVERPNDVSGAGRA